MKVGELSSRLLTSYEAEGKAAPSKRSETGRHEPAMQRAAEGRGEPKADEAGKGSGLDRERVEELVDELKRKLGVKAIDFKFKIHEESGQLQVEVLDADSEKVVRKIPPDELLDFKAALGQKDKAGAFLDRVY